MDPGGSSETWMHCDCGAIWLMEHGATTRPFPPITLQRELEEASRWQDPDPARH